MLILVHPCGNVVEASDLVEERDHSVWQGRRAGGMKGGAVQSRNEYK